MRHLTTPARDRGVALVAVLWFTVAIAGMAATFATLARGEALRSRNMVDAIRARTILEAGLNRAALELLTLVMLADHHFDPAEVDTIRDISEEWRGEAFSFDQYLGPAMAKVRAAMEQDTIAGLLDDIDSRISSHVLRRALFSAAREVAGVDADIAAAEGSLLAEIAVRFG